jgi:hypothetical protein
VVDATFIITAGTIKAGQISLTFFDKFMDFFRSQQVFKIERYGPNYRKEKFLWWTTLEEGEKIFIELRGKPAFCEAILKHLERYPLSMSTGATLSSMEPGSPRMRKVN